LILHFDADGSAFASDQDRSGLAFSMRLFGLTEKYDIPQARDITLKIGTA
jgi:hypothetical protein